MTPNLKGLAAFSLLFAFAAPVLADTLAWPGAAPCTTTLQACMDGSSPGDVIEIATETPVDEGLTVPHSLTLRSAGGVKARLAPFSYIIAVVAVGDPALSLTVEDLVLENGTIDMVHSGEAAANLTVRRVRIHQGSFNDAIEVRSTGSGNATVLVENCDIDLAGSDFSAPRGIGLSVNGTGSIDASVRFNRIRARNLGQNGVVESYNVGNGTLLLDVLANRIEGQGYNNGISVRGGGSTAWIVSNVIRGQVAESGFPGAITASSSDGPLEVHIVNNTVVDNERGIGVSVRADLGASVTGTIANNLVAHTQRPGIGFHEDAAIDEHHNLLYANGAGESPFVPGPGAVTANPRLRPDRFRVLADSPAIGAGDSPALNAVLAARGLPSVGIDGLRRIKGGTVDIGAFEDGLLHHLHSEASGGTGHVSDLDWPEVAGLPSAPIVFTQNWNPSSGNGVYNNAHVGTYYATGIWRLFNEGGEDMPEGADFNLLRTDTDGAFGHLATAGNASGFTSALDDPRVNGRPQAVLQVVHHWNGHGSPGVYADFPFAVAPTFGADWVLVNLADAPVPLATGYTVYTQDPSHSAYRHELRSGEVVANYGYLPHPLLDGAPCAQIQVTRGVPARAAPFGVWYDDGREQWSVFLQDTGISMQVGDEFHVLFDPAQVEECMRPVFRDGFETS